MLVGAHAVCHFFSCPVSLFRSPSTFGWWGAFYAFMGSRPDINIHWPIAPGNMGGMDWCNLMLRHPDTIARITYHDWYGVVHACVDPSSLPHPTDPAPDP